MHIGLGLWLRSSGSRAVPGGGAPFALSLVDVRESSPGIASPDNLVSQYEYTLDLPAGDLIIMGANINTVNNDSITGLTVDGDDATPIGPNIRAGSGIVRYNGRTFRFNNTSAGSKTIRLIGGHNFEVFMAVYKLENAGAATQFSTLPSEAVDQATIIFTATLNTPALVPSSTSALTVDFNDDIRSGENVYLGRTNNDTSLTLTGSPPSGTLVMGVLVNRGDADSDDGGATVGTARFAQYNLAADYTIATTSLVKPAYTALGTDADDLFDTANVRYVVDAADNGKFGIFTHSFMLSGDSGRDFVIAVQKAPAASPTAFVRECEMRHTTSMGLPVGQPFLLATGDVYEFVIICTTAGTSPTISAADLRNGISVEIIEEVSG